ncbi:hypothetical protein CMV_025298 [Castanea mollissima]|uniref:Uncharacterized protein n=1 Tax=Castanea mollissima TaxID=60419 RepID=A0A8J4QDM7_9ROSI|nr:hypothetical protein CMV_025298 [Castanea mollissima]
MNGDVCTRLWLAPQFMDSARWYGVCIQSFIWFGIRPLNRKVGPYGSRVRLKAWAKGSSGPGELTKKLLVVHVRRHADHVDDVLCHDHVGDVLCHHDELAGDVLRRDQDEHMGDVLRHHDEHMGDVLRHEHVVDVLHHHDNALLLHEDHDHDRRDAHRHHDNALLFRHVQVLHDVPLPHCGGEYDDDFRGETFSKVLLKSKLDQEVSL